LADFDGPLSLLEMKRAAARAALDFVEPCALVGVGSGSTTWEFVEALAESRLRLSGAVAASNETARRLASRGIGVVEFSADRRLEVYVDGADMVDMSGQAIKGGGAALTREKAVATASEYWVCIVDATKIVRSLHGAVIPLEVLAAGLGDVSEALREMGATVSIREGVLTDSGNPVLDALGLPLDEPLALEAALDAIPGVVGNGVFSRRRADVILVGRAGGGVGRIVPHHEAGV
jgi:ribose 5-phosphate isomerase A